MKLYLIRHAQSEGNVDPSRYKAARDHQIMLTGEGQDQAHDMGKALQKILLKNEVAHMNQTVFFTSPYLRARQTLQTSMRGGALNPINLFTNPLLREQEWKYFVDNNDSKEVRENRANFGKFYYRFKRGESIADTYQRATIFFNYLCNLMMVGQIKKEAPIIIYSHQTFLLCFMMVLTGEFDEKFDQDLPNASITYWNQDTKSFELLFTPKKRS